MGRWVVTEAVGHWEHAFGICLPLVNRALCFLAVRPELLFLTMPLCLDVLCHPRPKATESLDHEPHMNFSTSKLFLLDVLVTETQKLTKAVVTNLRVKIQDSQNLKGFPKIPKALAWFTGCQALQFRRVTEQPVATRGPPCRPGGPELGRPVLR